MNWRVHLKKILNKYGYEIYRIGKNHKYLPCPPYKFSTYAPWFKSWFQKIFSEIKNHTSVSENRCYIIYKLCQHCLNLEGHFAYILI